MKGKTMANRSLCTILVALGCVFAGTLARADERCVDNPESGANRPDICVDWDKTGQPTLDVNFDVQFTDLANPDVTLATGAAWNVRSKDNAGNPANIGDIKIDATVVTDSFDLAITDNSGGFGVGGPGATYEIRADDGTRVVTLRPNGAATCQPRASPWVCDAQYQKALKGRNKQSIPNVPFIKIKTMATQEHPKLFLERHRPMMLFLLLDVPPNMFQLRLADGKRPVSILPTKARKRLPLGLDPF